ncbi:hypothetical protein, partial [Olsenella sp. oral taxon 809]|uniref:hypothetical protein n=1 Tax=Olsenella sp. oral taxon 809 TaxID=661086 RepID=UPI001E5DCC36
MLAERALAGGRLAAVGRPYGLRAPPLRRGGATTPTMALSRSSARSMPLLGSPARLSPRLRASLAEQERFGRPQRARFAHVGGQTYGRDPAPSRIPIKNFPRVSARSLVTHFSQSRGADPRALPHAPPAPAQSRQLARPVAPRLPLGGLTVLLATTSRPTAGAATCGLRRD